MSRRLNSIIEFSVEYDQIFLNPSNDALNPMNKIHNVIKINEYYQNVFDIYLKKQDKNYIRRLFTPVVWILVMVFHRIDEHVE
jgi:hypothetical protein